MEQENVIAAAELLLKISREGGRLERLPDGCMPLTRADGYAIQAEVAKRSGRRVAGWKIAGTSEAGQKHIGVEGPIAARLLSERVIADGLTIPMQCNVMNVGEAEFAFRIGQALPPRREPYQTEDVMRAVGSLHLAIEVPDSRYRQFNIVGERQLIADLACASWLVVGPATRADWRSVNLSKHRVKAYLNDILVDEGSGANVLGDPRVALTWLANEVSRLGVTLVPGDLITTGACVAPVSVEPGDALRADFGMFGSVAVGFS